MAPNETTLAVNSRTGDSVFDVRMVRIDGPTMVRHYKAERPGMKVRLVSEHSSESVPIDCMKNFYTNRSNQLQSSKKVQELLTRDERFSMVRDSIPSHWEGLVGRGCCTSTSGLMIRG
jgi:hypothetical protein